MHVFVTKHQAAACLFVSTSTLKRYRLNGELIEGVHWVRLNSRCIRYNLEILKDWFKNRDNLQVHLQTIDEYLQSLPSNQKKEK
jgi:tRNA(His) 5'-end guanylyltransferase